MNFFALTKLAINPASTAPIVGPHDDLPGLY
jgi:hypothetical protein